MAEQHGKQLIYLGIDPDYINKVKVVITMNSYIKEVLDKFQKEDWTPSSSPSNYHLFEVN